MGANKRPRTKSLTRNQAPPKRVKKQQDTFSFLSPDSHTPLQPALPPLRQHASNYHRPALLDHVPSQSSLLAWFETVSKDRDMPWRQKWINPSIFSKSEKSGLDLRETLKRRAYQVWISEIMLQQTRVETVRAYYTSWHTRWPTIEDLAKAEEAEVLNAWKGLGYYSRATRIHKAAKMIVDDADMKGLLPESPSELEAKVPGVGRYTAGAVSSIVFGHAVPILDGNVMRVLCRQMGLYANMKSKVTTDLLWEVADRLVKRVAREALVKKGVEMEDEEEIPKSEIPSFWNQALMELGSTLCKPVKPDCASCPVKETCLAYAEGELLAVEKGSLDAKSSSAVFDRTTKVQIPDIEDLCSYCESMEEIEVPDESKPKSKSTTKVKSQSQQKPGLKQGTLAFGQKSKTTKETTDSKANLTPKAKELIEKHVSLFPLKVIKKAVRNEEHNVCIIIRTNPSGEDEYLVEQRPDKGLLASLWQFPSSEIFNDEGQTTNASEEDDASEIEDSDGLPVTLHKPKLKKKTKIKHKGLTMVTPQDPPDAKRRKHRAITFVNSVLRKTYEPHRDDEGMGVAAYMKEIGSLTHLFSHIRLVMHVHTFTYGITGSDHEHTLEMGGGEIEYQQRKWVGREELEEISFGTGMRRCWGLYLERYGKV